MSFVRGAALALALGGAVPAAGRQDVVDGRLVQFNDNGAWSWFEDERAVVDAARGRVLVGSCADGSGVGGTPRDGDIDVAWLDVASGTLGAFELRDRLQDDDHNSPALLVRPDGRYLAMYGTHGSTDRSYWRVSDVGDPSSWSPEASFSHGAGLTYSNLHHVLDPNLPGGSLTYNFGRSVNFDPNVMWSADQGTTWSGLGKLLTEGGGGDRPYLKYSHDGGARVHVLATERHPRNFPNSIYHGYVEGGALHDSFGAVLDGDVTDGSAVAPSQLTTVLQDGTVFGGTAMRRAWTIDIDAGTPGEVRALFQARAADSPNDHRLFHGRFDGSAWDVHEVCRLGAYLYSSERDYTGLAALDPDDPSRIFVSTPIDPRTVTATARYEIYEARTADGGASWSFSSITQASTVDNLRPIVPAWDQSRTALLWFRGNYSTFTDYDVAVVGVVEAPELAVEPATYHDATPQNTTLAAGGAVPTTGPSGAAGASDGAWHLRASAGNGGEVWTSSETGAEDAPTLRTTVTGLVSGAHDVYVAFWSQPGLAWSIRAGLSPTGLRAFEPASAQTATAELVRGPVTTSSAGAVLYVAWLGRADVGPGGELDVWIDDVDAGQSAATRTWYDGVAVAPVTCAPAERHCDALPNTLGTITRIDRAGTCSIATNDLVLVGTDAPPGAFSIFLYGQGRAQLPLADGRLCLATRIGRMGVQQADFLGIVVRPLDLSAPLGSGAAVAAGESWSFQLWYRDASPGGANLSDAIEVTFSQ